MSDFDDDNLDVGDEIEEQFNRAASHIQIIHTQLKNSDLLDLYGLYKQSTTGNCNISKPGIFNAQGRAKWIAWNNLGNLDKRKAMELYIQKISDLSPNWDNATNEKAGWVSVSIHKPEPDEEINESEKTSIEYIKENNIEKLKEILDSEKINELDDSGMGLIHWATDRNASEILEYLLNSGANVNLQDNEGQTALHYAASCGHSECVLILLKNHADKNIKDNDDMTCFEVAYDSNIRKLL